MPAARRSKRETTKTTFLSLAIFARASVAGPGTGSARLKRSASSLRQKYSLRKSSCNEMICAPRAEASRILSIARERFSSALVVQRIWARPTVNLFAISVVKHREQVAAGGPSISAKRQAAHIEYEKMRVNLL